jgi:type I restriction-modification system DNA methylase subunit
MHKIQFKDITQKQFHQIFSSISQKYDTWELWTDFILLSSIAVSNRVDRYNYQDRENYYMKAINKYDKSTQEKFSELFSLFISGITKNPWQDWLGYVATMLNLTNRQNEQIFTPYCLAKLSADITMNNLSKSLKKKPFISVYDPCCGSGSLLIAAAETANAQKINFQEKILMIGQDISLTAGLMCYLQLSFLNCAGYIVIGDTLSKPCTGETPFIHPNPNIWFTPMYFSNQWTALRRLS